MRADIARIYRKRIVVAGQGDDAIAGAVAEMQGGHDGETDKNA